MELIFWIIFTVIVILALILSVLSSINFNHNFKRTLKRLNKGSFILPNYVKTITEKSFSKADKLENILVNKNNKYFSSVNGVLYNKDQTRLIKYPQAKIDKSFIIPDTVKIISSNAFFGVRNLIDLTIPNNVIIIEKMAFAGYLNLQTISVPFIGRSRDAGGESATFKYIFNSSNSYEYTKDFSPKSLKKVVLTDAKIIKREAFYGNSTIKSLILNEGITTLEDYAFFNMQELQEINLPKSIEKIGSGFLSYTPNLKSIKIDSEEDNICLYEDEVLYNKDKTTLVKYNKKQPGNTFNIPESVITISGEAFRGVDTLEFIIIPLRIKYIESWVFAFTNMTVYIEAEKLPEEWNDDLFENFKGKAYWGGEWIYNKKGEPEPKD